MLKHDLLKQLSNLFDFDMTQEDLTQKIEWDSLQVISFLSFLSDQFGHFESPESLKKIGDYTDLITYVETITRGLS